MLAGSSIPMEKFLDIIQGLGLIVESHFDEGAIDNNKIQGPFIWGSKSY